jgi:hypothetical protein
MAMGKRLDGVVWVGWQEFGANPIELLTQNELEPSGRYRIENTSRKLSEKYGQNAGH